MSIDIGTNINLSCGLKLPTLYIDTVTVRSDSLDVKVSLYVSVAAEHDIGDLHEELSGIYYYLMPVVDGMPSTPSGYRETEAVMSTGDVSEWLTSGGSPPSFETTETWSQVIASSDYTSDEYAGGTSNIGKLISSQIGVFEYAYRSVSIDSYFDFFEPFTEETQEYEALMIAGHKQFKKLSIEDFTYVEEFFKTDASAQGQNSDYKVIRLTAETELPSMFSYLSDGTVSSESARAQQLYSMAETGTPADITSISEEFYITMGFQNMALFSFTMTENLSTNFIDLFEGDVALSYNNNSRLVNFYDSLVSQLSYQRVFIDGIPARPPNVLFTYERDGKNVIYNGDVMQTLDGSYHAFGNNFNREQLVERLFTLSQGFSDTLEISDAFQMAIDSFNAMMITYGDTDELLIRLNMISKSYLDKSSITPMGNWYRKFNSSLLSFNRDFVDNQLLRKELVTTPTVIDGRGLTEDAALVTSLSDEIESLGIQDDYNQWDYIYSNAIIMERLGISDTYQLLESAWADDDFDYHVVETGFFFFDYEKALHVDSNIAQVSNVSQVEGNLGKNILNRYFKISSVEFKRYACEPSDFVDFCLNAELIYTKTTTFDDSVESSGPIPIGTTLVMGGWSDDGTPPAGRFKFDPAGGETTYFGPSGWPEDYPAIYPMLAPRNILLNESVAESYEGVNDYRLLGFEFTELVDSQGAFGLSLRDSDRILITVTVNDQTSELFTLLATSFSEYIDAFDEYYELATEFCSYNNIDGYFNDFFIEAMESRYSGDPQAAPWIVGPTYLAIHREFLQNEFGGNEEAIINYATTISEQIAPATGNYESLITFKEQLDEIRAYYEASLEEIGEPVDRKYYGRINMQDFSLPDFPNLSRDAADILSETWNESVTYFIKLKVWEIFTTWYAFWTNSDVNSAWTECNDITELFGSSERESKCGTFKEKFKDHLQVQRDLWREIYELARNQGQPGEAGGRFHQIEKYDIDNPARDWLNDEYKTDDDGNAKNESSRTYDAYVDIWKAQELVAKYQELQPMGMAKGIWTRLPQCMRAWYPDGYSSYEEQICTIDEVYDLHYVAAAFGAARDTPWEGLKKLFVSTPMYYGSEFYIPAGESDAACDDRLAEDMSDSGWFPIGPGLDHLMLPKGQNDNRDDSYRLAALLNWGYKLEGSNEEYFGDSDFNGIANHYEIQYRYDPVISISFGGAIGTPSTPEEEEESGPGPFSGLGSGDRFPIRFGGSDDD